MAVGIFVDGSGKTGNYAYVVEWTNEAEVFQKEGITNNQAEYLATIEALKHHQEKEVEIFSDSQLLVNQLNHKYAIKNDELRKLAQEVWKLCEGRNVEFVWVPRSKNLAGKFLG